LSFSNYLLQILLDPDFNLTPYSSNTQVMSGTNGNYVMEAKNDEKDQIIQKAIVNWFSFNGKHGITF